ncbi:kinase domain protein (macronuclear) [Tetrahymena thermophila SB210]|uniref:Cyclin-dependent kinase 2 homolog n=1 Tax=Tetrahymena thermophila (strain SB210) TaxID=312017 RepID=I7M0T1_TETTS|nr:kinase domain protein [Tetrahymena thermophila SB210]EAR90886.3 kinase domain protein [Tetrahymena thermophila SB210]|eukprot:XP_001011131.3 kinase domain protein [Tetrahymena thermophila SB210]
MYLFMFQYIQKEKDANLTTSTFFVFEYCEHDLEGMFLSKIRFNLPQIKRVIHSILMGLSELQKKNIIHRDIKTDNILYNKNREIKVADFGLSKDLNIKRAPLSKKLQNIFYRAPESLLGSQHYSFKVDIWCAGIIFYQLLFRNQENVTYKALFAANFDEQLKQAKNYFSLLGNPENENIWSQNSKNELKMKDYDAVLSQITPEEKANFKNRFIEHLKGINPNVDDSALDLLSKMLTLDPSLRFSADECLQHEFFQQEPEMASFEEMPRIDEGQEYHYMTQIKVQNERYRQNVEQQQFQQAIPNQNAIILPVNTQISPIRQGGVAGQVSGNQQFQMRRSKNQVMPNINNNNQRNSQNQMVMNVQANQNFPSNGQIPNVQGGVPSLQNQHQNLNRFNNQQQNKNQNMQQKFTQQPHLQNPLNQQLQNPQSQKQVFPQQNGYRKQLPLNQQQQGLHTQPQQFLQNNTDKEVPFKNSNIVGNNFNKNQQKRNNLNQNINNQTNQAQSQKQNNNQYNSMQYKSNNNQNMINKQAQSYQSSSQDQQKQTSLFQNPQKQNQHQGIISNNQEMLISQNQQQQHKNSNYYKGGKPQFTNQVSHQPILNPPNSNSEAQTVPQVGGQNEKNLQIDNSFQEDYQQNCTNFSESTEVSNQENTINFKNSQFSNQNISNKNDSQQILCGQIPTQKNSNSFTNLPADSQGNRVGGNKRFQDSTSNINCHKRKLSLQESQENIINQSSSIYGNQYQAEQQVSEETRKKQKLNITVNTNLANKTEASPNQTALSQPKNSFNSLQNNQLDSTSATPTQLLHSQQVVSPILSAGRPYAASFDLLKGSSYIKGLEQEKQQQQLIQIKNQSNNISNLYLTSSENKVPSAQQGVAVVNTTGLQILQQIAQDCTQIRRSFNLNASIQPMSSISEKEGVISARLSNSNSLTNEKPTNQQLIVEYNENGFPLTPDFSKQEDIKFGQGRQQNHSSIEKRQQQEELPINNQRGNQNQKMRKKAGKLIQKNQNKNKQLLNQYSQASPLEQISNLSAAPNQIEQVIQQQKNEAATQSLFQNQGGVQHQSNNLNIQNKYEQMNDLSQSVPQKTVLADEELANTPVQQKCSSTASSTVTHQNNMMQIEESQDLKASQNTQQETAEPIIREKTQEFNFAENYPLDLQSQGYEFNNYFGKQASFSQNFRYNGFIQSPPHLDFQANYLISPNLYFQNNEQSPFLLHQMTSAFPQAYQLNNSGDSAQN